MTRPKTASRREEERDEIVTIIRHAELFHESGVALPTRTIYMGSNEVDSDGIESGTDAKMTERFLKNLHVLESLDSNKPITVIMNNTGGCEYSGAAIYDAIKLTPCPVTILVRGHAMSMGSLILQAADERVMSPSSKQLLHYGTWGVGAQHALDNERHAEEGKWWNGWMREIYLARIREKHPSFTEDQVNEMLRFDTYLTASQSVELGLADRIG